MILLVLVAIGVVASTSRSPPPAAVAALAVAVLWPTTDAHNWMNNPRSRTKGLSKQFPCPARSGQSISFLAVKGKPFGLEYAQGHPKTYTYFAMVHARDEDKLRHASEASLNEYLSSAPEAAKSTSPGGFLSDPIFDKTAIEWSGGRAGDTVPLADKNRPWYEKRLKPGDANFFHRPAEWRCSRDKNFNTAEKCKQAGVEVAQYKYIPSGLEYDVRAAYRNEKKPWLLAAAKYKHNFKRAQEYDLAQMMFPDSAEPGRYVIMYQWRGYYDCLDVLLIDNLNAGGGVVSVPKLVLKEKWIKTDHSQYEPSSGYVFKNKDRSHFCDVLPSSGDVSKCLETCDRLKSTCNAINVVPYNNLPLVSFDEVNIPTTSRCTAALQNKGVSKSSLVCYGFLEPDTPDVGTPNTISDDPRDAVFYSTSYLRMKIPIVEYTYLESGNDTVSHEEHSPTKEPWRFGDQCLSCHDAQKHASRFFSFVFRWTMQNECHLCEE